VLLVKEAGGFVTDYRGQDRSFEPLHVIDQVHLPLGRRIGPGRAAQQDGGLFHMLLVDCQFGQLGQRRGVLRLLEQMLAQQSLGIAGIAGLERVRGLFEHQLRLGCRGRQSRRGMKHQ
jgi:hypothetical protein